MKTDEKCQSQAGRPITALEVAWQALLAESKQHPWVMRLLLQRGAELVGRYVEHYRRLLTLSRQQRRVLMRRAGVSLAGAALLLSLGRTPAFANDIPVDGTTCTLVDAMTAANTDSVVGGCVAGGGADTITLLTNVALTAVNNANPATYTYNGLPVVESEITIDGAGLTISRTGGPKFRILDVAASGTLTLTNATISGGNAYQSDGGGIRNLGTLTLSNATVTGNHADEQGGGVHSSGRMRLENSTVSNNTAKNEGGGLSTVNSGSTTILNSTISGNSVSGSNIGNGGGGIYSGGYLTLSNSTVSGNSSGRDGGGIKSSWVMVLQQTTITGNTADHDGGGIFKSTYSFSMKHSLISGNTATNTGAEIAVSGVSVYADNENLMGHNGLTNAQAFSGFSPGSNDITATSNGTNPTVLANILNTTLADNGGPTRTHALISGSPAINAIPTGSLLARGGDAATGLPFRCTANTSYDQRGIFRAAGGGTGAACDIGAFEFGATPTSVTIVAFSSQTVWGSGPQLVWETASESALSGFHIWRGNGDTAETRLTDDLIGAAGGLNGSSYAWQDSLGLGWGTRTFYWLEAVAADGSSSFTGPVEVWGIGKLFLPAVAR